VRAAVVVALALAPAAARAQPPVPVEQAPPAPPDAAPDAEDAEAQEAPAPAPAGVSAHPDWTLELGGRVFVRDTLSRVDVGDSVWRHDRDIDQARLSAVYDRKRLRLAVEVDFAGDHARLKDTYIRVRPVRWLRVQAGRFKVPMSFIGLESKWRLPSVERGLLGELELDDRDLPFAGARADGVAVELRPKVALSPRLTLAAFQSPLAGGMAPLDPTEEVTQDVYLRGEIEPIDGLHVAAAGALVGYDEQLGQPDTFRHVALGSVELHLDARHLRAWLEGFAGESFSYQPDGSSSGRFVAARALVSPRLRRPLPGLFRLEPYAGASLFDPTDDVDGDRASEIVAGVNVAFSRHWRVQLEVAERIAQGQNAPVADTTLVRLQMGAAFSEAIQ
jgi:hypothetical protein